MWVFCLQIDARAGHTLNEIFSALCGQQVGVFVNKRQTESL